jgi:hypothetical protein
MADNPRNPHNFPHHRWRLEPIIFRVGKTSHFGVNAGKEYGLHNCLERCLA